MAPPTRLPPHGSHGQAALLGPLARDFQTPSPSGQQQRPAPPFAWQCLAPPQPPAVPRKVSPEPIQRLEVPELSVLVCSRQALPVRHELLPIFPNHLSPRTPVPAVPEGAEQRGMDRQTDRRGPCPRRSFLSEVRWPWPAFHCHGQALSSETSSSSGRVRDRSLGAFSSLSGKDRRADGGASPCPPLAGAQAQRGAGTDQRRLGV